MKVVAVSYLVNNVKLENSVTNAIATNITNMIIIIFIPEMGKL